MIRPSKSERFWDQLYVFLHELGMRHDQSEHSVRQLLQLYRWFCDNRPADNTHEGAHANTTSPRTGDNKVQSDSPRKCNIDELASRLLRIDRTSSSQNKPSEPTERVVVVSLPASSRHSKTNKKSAPSPRRLNADHMQPLFPASAQSGFRLTPAISRYEAATINRLRTGLGKSYASDVESPDKTSPPLRVDDIYNGIISATTKGSRAIISTKQKIRETNPSAGWGEVHQFDSSKLRSPSASQRSRSARNHRTTHSPTSASPRSHSARNHRTAHSPGCLYATKQCLHRRATSARSPTRYDCVNSGINFPTIAKSRTQILPRPHTAPFPHRPPRSPKADALTIEIMQDVLNLQVSTRSIADNHNNIPEWKISNPGNNMLMLQSTLDEHSIEHLEQAPPPSSSSPPPSSSSPPLPPPIAIPTAPTHTDSESFS